MRKNFISDAGVICYWGSYQCNEMEIAHKDDDKKTKTKISCQGQLSAYN